MCTDKTPLHLPFVSFTSKFGLSQYKWTQTDPFNHRPFIIATAKQKC